MLLDSSCIPLSTSLQGQKDRTKTLAKVLDHGISTKYTCTHYRAINLNCAILFSLSLKAPSFEKFIKNTGVAPHKNTLDTIFTSQSCSIDVE